VEGKGCSRGRRGPSEIGSSRPEPVGLEKIFYLGEWPVGGQRREDVTREREYRVCSALNGGSRKYFKWDEPGDEVVMGNEV